MNYSLIIAGYRFETFDECMKLLIFSAHQSDYIAEIQGYDFSSPVSPKRCKLLLTGSSKKIYNDIIVDFDNILIKSDCGIVISPESAGLEALPDATHYWAILGVLCKIISDISPAYVKGYLLEKDRKKELDLFTKFSNQLPFSLQIALNEGIKDSE